MAVAMTVERFLNDCGVAYDVLQHPYTLSSTRTAQTGHVSGESVAKAVVLKSEGGYTMAILPATRHVKLGEIQDYLKRPVGLATEAEVSRLFSDCELGAIPPVGRAYGMEVIVDDSLNDLSDIYFEAGDHMNLIHVNAFGFRRLMGDAQHGRFSRHD